MRIGFSSVSAGSMPCSLDTSCYTGDMSLLSLRHSLVWALLWFSLSWAPSPLPTGIWFTPDAPLDTSQVRFLY